MARWGMVVDLRKCVGCQTCTIACKQTNNTPPTAQLDRSLFRYARFAEGKPVVGKYEYGIVG